ncbi:MAG: hypothetical protein Q8L98_05910 [Chlamydiales bacterium]|nr:hypothetical protein [Chlamydiales bacterium]
MTAVGGERPVSPETLLTLGSFVEFKDPSRTSQLWLIIAEDAVNCEEPGSLLAKVIKNSSSDSETCQKIIAIATKIFFPNKPEEKKYSIGQAAQEFVDQMKGDRTKPPLSSYPSLFQLLGKLYALLNDPTSSQMMHSAAASLWSDKENFSFAAESFIEMAKQVLLMNSNKQEEAAGLFIHAGDLHRKHRSELNSIVSCYHLAREQYEIMGEFVRAAEVMEKIAEVYHSTHPEMVILSFERAASYYQWAGDLKKEAISLEKAAIYARANKCFRDADFYNQAAFLFKKTEDLQDAVRCFVGAARAYRAYERDGWKDAYKEAINCVEKLQDYIVAASLYAESSAPVNDIYIGYVVKAAGQSLEKGWDKEATEYFREAAIYYEEKGEFCLAAEYFEKVLDLIQGTSVHDIEMLGKVAELYKQGKNLVKALGCCARGIREDGAPFVNWNQIIEECLDLFIQLPLSSLPEERSTGALCLTEIANLLKKRSNGELAAKAYQLVALWEERDVEAAHLFIEVGKWFDYSLANYDFALFCYEQAVSRFLLLGKKTDAAKVFRDMGYLYKKNKEFQKAAKAYITAAEHSETFEFAEVDYAKAAKLYVKAAFSKEAINSYIQSATFNRTLSDFERAGRFFEQAADLYDKGEQWSLAAKYWKEAAHCFATKSTTVTKASQLFHQSAEAYRKAACYVEAADTYVLAMNHFSEPPDQAICCLEAAKCYATMNSSAYFELQTRLFFRAAELYAPIDSGLAIDSLNQAIGYSSDRVPIRSDWDLLCTKPPHFIFKAMGIYGKILSFPGQPAAVVQNLERCLLWCESVVGPRVEEEVVRERVEMLICAAKGFEIAGKKAMAVKACLLAAKWAALEEDSARYLQMALDLKGPASIIEASEKLAPYYLRVGKKGEAAKVFHVKGEHFERFQLYEQAAVSFEQAGSTFHEDKQNPEAAFSYRKAADNWKKTRNVSSSGSCYDWAGRLFFAAGSIDQATSCFDQALIEFEKDLIKKDQCCTRAASEFSRRGYGKLAVSYYKQVSSSDMNTSILYLEQAASCSRDQPAEEALFWEAAGCKRAIMEMDRKAAEDYYLAAVAYDKSSQPLKAAQAYFYAKDYYHKIQGSQELEAQCCCKLADCLMKTDLPNDFKDPLFYYELAGKLYLWINTSLAIKCFERAKGSRSIIDYFSKMNTNSSSQPMFLKKAAEWFASSGSFIEAMGVYGLILNKYQQKIHSDLVQECYQAMEISLQECEQIKESPLIEAAVYAGKAFEKISPLSAARSYKLAGIWAMKQKGREGSSVRYLMKAKQLHETQPFIPSQLEVSKLLANLYKRLGDHLAAAKLLQSMGATCHKHTIYKESATFFDQAADCYKLHELISEAVSCYISAALNWSLLSCYDDVAHSLEQAGDCLFSVSGKEEEALDYFLKAGALFEKNGKTKGKSRCFLRAAQLSSNRRRYREALHYYSKIDPVTFSYQDQVHIDYLYQAALEATSLGDILSASSYYEKIGAIHQQSGMGDLAEPFLKKSAQCKAAWLQPKTDQLWKLLQDALEHQRGYAKVRSWVQELVIDRMIDAAIEHLKQCSFEETTQQQLRHLTAHCHQERIERFLNEPLHKDTIIQVLAVVRERIQELKRTPAISTQQSLTFIQTQE